MMDTLLLIMLVACFAALIAIMVLLYRHHRVFCDGLETGGEFSPFLVYGGSVKDDLRKAAENSRRLSEGIDGLRKQLLSRFDQRQQSAESESETHRLLSQVIARNEVALAQLRDGQAWVTHRSLLEGVLDSVRVLRFQEADSPAQALARLSAVLEVAGIREIPEGDLIGHLAENVAARVRLAQERVPLGQADVPLSVHSVAEPGFEIDLGIDGQAPRVVLPALVRVFAQEFEEVNPLAKAPTTDLAETDKEAEAATEGLVEEKRKNEVLED